MTLPTAAEEQKQPPEMAESAAKGLDPVQLGAESPPAEIAKALQERDNLAAAVSGIARAIGEMENELGRIESRMDGVLQGPAREKLRRARNDLRERLVDRREAHQSGIRQREQLDQLLQLDSVEAALTKRKTAQAAGTRIAEEMRVLIACLAQQYRRWQGLKEEDRIAADIVRSLMAARFSEVATYSWATGVDEHFAGAIALVVSESLRSNKELLKRIEAAGG